MRVITVDNVNSALPAGLALLKKYGVEAPSRNGPVLAMPCPVTTAYTRPTQRVLFGAVRDANPFFHLFESLWMLAGHNDTAFVARYNPRMATFSDDNDAATQNGAYGYRWRQHFNGVDQLLEVALLLARDPTTRRAMLGMWDPAQDLVNQGSKDLPCNTHVYFDASRGVLDMTVCCRSNDVVWGAYGANAVHMSFMQEWLALYLNIPVGTYYQMSNNYHVYTEREDVKRLYEALDTGYVPVAENLYKTAQTGVTLESPLLGNALLEGPAEKWAIQFLAACQVFCRALSVEVWSEDYEGLDFFRRVVRPMASAHRLYREQGPAAALELLLSYVFGGGNGLGGVGYTDWTLAARDWLLRRVEARAAKEQAQRAAQ